jgi:hypothetical protein
VRMTDYLTDPVTQKKHGTCDSEYYKRALEYITEKVSNPHFYVFSDDMQWTKQNLDIPQPVCYVDQNSPNMGHVDMYLMSLCRHHIIANSTFSWWGAWLNKNPDKIVIAPKKWFAAAEYNSDDLIPSSWIRI